MLRTPSTPARIARETECTVQYAGRILRRLEQDGFVELVDKKGTWKYYRLTKRGRSLALSAYSSTTRDIHQEHGLYDSFDPNIVDVSNGSTERYLTIRIAGQPPYLPLFPRFGFDSGALTFLGPLLVRSSGDGFPSETKYTLGMTGAGFFDSLDEFTTFVELLRKHFWASDLCFTLDRSAGNELVLGWGTANLAEALRESKSWRTKFGVLLSMTTPHPVIVIGDYEKQRLRFHLLVTSWYIPVSKELEELNRLFALAGAEITELVPNKIEEGPVGDEFHQWQQSFWEERDRKPRKCKISHYANRDRQPGGSAKEPWYYWVVASNPMLSDSLDRYAVDDYVLKHVLDSQVMPLLPIRLNMAYKRSELADVLSIRSLRLEYSILQLPALPEHYGYYGPVIVNPVVEHKIEA